MAVTLGTGVNNITAAVDGSVTHTDEAYAANLDVSGESEIAILSRVIVKCYGKRTADNVWEVAGYVGPQADLDNVTGDQELKIKGTLNTTTYSRLSLTATGAESVLVKVQSSSGILTGGTSEAITSITSLGVAGDGEAVLGSIASGAMTFKRVAAKSNAGTAVTQHSSGNVIEVALDDDVLGMTKHQALGNVTGTISWDAQAGNCASLTATGNLTFSGITNVQAGTYMLKIVQDATGGRTLTLGASCRKAGGTAITLSTAASACDILSIFYDGTYYYVAASLNFS